MARKKIIPPIYETFKTEVSKHNLQVQLKKYGYCDDWCASVLYEVGGVMRCIWHNSPNDKQLPLEKFWESQAWITHNDKNNKK